MRRQWSIALGVPLMALLMGGCGDHERPHAPGTVRKLNQVGEQRFDWTIGGLGYANHTLYMTTPGYSRATSLRALDPDDVHIKLWPLSVL